MPDFWLDSCCLIEAKRGYYGFDIVPGFWAFLERKAEDGTIGSCRLVYEELQELEDELSKWAREQNEKGFFVDSGAPVQAVLSEISEYVTNSYERRWADEFLDGADPWLIAHAKVDGGKVVTLEVSAPAGKKAKIPDVAREFGVNTSDLLQFLRECNFSATWVPHSGR